MQATKPQPSSKGVVESTTLVTFKGVLGVVRGNLLEVTPMSR